MADHRTITFHGGYAIERIASADLELYLNDADQQELRHAAICVLHRLGEIAPFDLDFYPYPPGDDARIGAERLMRALAPVCLPELRRMAA